MALRVAESEVREYAQLSSDVAIVSQIAMANRLTDRVDAQDTDGLLSSGDLYDIELNLAAHFAVQHEKNQQYTNRSTEGASGSFQGQFADGLSSSHYGQNAIMLDQTGFLRSLSKGKRIATATWLGKPVSSQIDLEERD